MKVRQVNIIAEKLAASNQNQIEDLLRNDCHLLISGLSTPAIYEDSKTKLETEFSIPVLAEYELIHFKDKINRPNAADNIENLLKQKGVGNKYGITRNEFIGASDRILHNYYHNILLPDLSYTGITEFPELELLEIHDTVRATATKQYYNNIDGIWFEGCDNLASCSLPQGLTDTNEVFVDNINLRYVKVPYGVKTITRTFKGCSTLEKVDLPDTVIEIGHEAFANDYKFNITDWPTSLKKITGSAFYNCTSIDHVTLPDGLTVCGDFSGTYTNSFQGCTGLIDVTFPSTCLEIGKDAFSGDTALQEVTFNQTNPVRIGLDCFNGCIALNRVNATHINNWCRNEFATEKSNPLYYAHNLYFNGSVNPGLIGNHVNRYSFVNCTSITGINVVGGLEPKAFVGCTNINGVMFGGLNTNSADAVVQVYLTPNNSLNRILGYNQPVISKQNFIRVLAQAYLGLTYDGQQRTFGLFNNNGAAGWNNGTIIQDCVRQEDLDILQCGTPEQYDDTHVKVHSNLFGGFNIIYNPDFSFCEFQDHDNEIIVQDILGTGYGVPINVLNELEDLNSKFLNSKISKIDWLRHCHNVTDIRDAFRDCKLLTGDVSGLNMPNLKFVSGTNRNTGIGPFKGTNITSFDGTGMNMSNVEGGNMMFRDCTKLKSLNLSDWDTSRITFWENFFYNCAELKYLNLSNKFSSASQGLGVYLFSSGIESCPNIESFIVGPKMFDCVSRDEKPMTDFRQHMNFTKMTKWVNVDEIRTLVLSLPDLSSKGRMCIIGVSPQTKAVMDSNGLTGQVTAKNWTISTT